jgi:hypothetical protein
LTYLQHVIHMNMNKKFDYGKFYIEYRKERNGLLHFLKKKIDNLEDALKESNKLRDLGYHDILIKKSEA